MIILNIFKNNKFILIFSILIANSIYITLCKPLTTKVLEFLDKDEEIYIYYRQQYRYLNCKLLTYSRLKYFYEQEIIDQYINKTNNKEEFLDFLKDKMMNFCLTNYKANNLEIFEPEQYVGWNTENDKWVAVDINDAYTNFTQIEIGQKQVLENKSDL